MKAKETFGDSGVSNYCNIQLSNQNWQDVISRVSAAQNSDRGAR